MNMILSELVSSILSFDIDERVENKLKVLKYDERVKLAYLLTVYSDFEKSNALINLINNHLLYEKTMCMTCALVDLKCNVENKEQHLKIKELLNSFITTYDEQKDKISNLMYCISMFSEMPLNLLSVNSKKEHMEIFLS
jgi:hypothetical protein